MVDFSGVCLKDVLFPGEGYISMLLECGWLIGHGAVWAAAEVRGSACYFVGRWGEGEVVRDGWVGGTVI